MLNLDITKKHCFLKIEIVERLRSVLDPELEINIVDLGLIYSVEINEKDQSIQIEMTLSSPGCPMGTVILGAVQNCMEHHYPKYKTFVTFVWEPVGPSNLFLKKESDY
ncbi:MAG: metal-sulfur cluster assembly factor [Daejeonella sp.]|nr:metal-sulfur cluster assembly factor [Daejeonella sp.]